MSISQLNVSKPFKILLHGFSDRAITTWTIAFRNEYLKKYDCNVICIDWQPLAESPWYTTAAKNTKNVGQFTANFIHVLISKGASYNDFHIIGSSLGAQVAGYIGYYTHGKLARITGLDPSGSLFHTVSTKDRLDATDAQFVDIIHTAGKWIGNDDNQGDVDFFVNGGKAPQPGCQNKEFLDLTCSHFKAWIIFKESISSMKFVSVRCKHFKDFQMGVCCQNHDHVHDIEILGENVNTSQKGSFYLFTNSISPHEKSWEKSIGCLS